MSSFITQDDYKAMMPENRKNQAISNDLTILEAVETTAVQIVKDALYSKYDVDWIFVQSGASRPPQVVRWCVVIAVHQIYERIPDAQVPAKVGQAYEEVMEVLAQIEDGKKSLQLPLKPLPNPPTKFRWGSNPPRTH